MRNRFVLAIVVLLIVVALPVGWWLFSPLILDRAVDEAFPSGAVAEVSVVESADAGADVDLSDTNSAEEVRALQQAPEGDETADEPMPTPDDEAVDWVAVAQGSFQDADASHRGSGTATIFQQGDQRVLRFEDFEVTNGPDLHVLLVENIGGTSSDELGEYVDLGALKGNVGSQNYDIPADLDLAQFSGIVIYCQPFHVVFSTAPF